MNFQTKYNYAQSDGEVMSTICRTEQAGYIPPKIQIEQMIMAGKRLALARLEQYDEYDGKGSLEIDPTRKYGLDLAEASQLQAQALQNIQNAQKAQETTEAVETTDKEAAEVDSGK